MSDIEMFGIVLIAAGTLGLAYQGFSYTKETHEAKISPLELSVDEKQTVSIPLLVGVGALVAGGFLLLVPKTELAASGGSVALGHDREPGYPTSKFPVPNRQE
jgi:hypothetical protein